VNIEIHTYRATLLTQKGIRTRYETVISNLTGQYKLINNILMKLKALFLDKDGTVIPNIPLKVDPNKVSLKDPVVEGLQMLQSNGYLLVMVSNQPHETQNYFTTEQEKSEENALSRMCARMGIYLDGFYSPEQVAVNKNMAREQVKAEPGLLLKAANDMNIDLSSSWMIGDIVTDVETGNRAGCRSILVNKNDGANGEPDSIRKPEYTTDDFADAARHIIAVDTKPEKRKRSSRKKQQVAVSVG
jgi:histidinol-phosphate phosphatase family protein